MLRALRVLGTAPFSIRNIIRHTPRPNLIACQSGPAVPVFGKAAHLHHLLPQNRHSLTSARIVLDRESSQRSSMAGESTSFLTHGYFAKTTIRPQKHLRLFDTTPTSSQKGNFEALAKPPAKIMF